MAGPRDTDREREARHILNGIARETDTSGTSFMARTAKSVQNHVSARDGDPSDKIEYWGTRIGRVMGLILAGAMLIGLVIYLVRGG